MKEYKFFGWQQANMPAVASEYRLIKNPRHLYDLLSEIWCAKTCAPRMRDNWTPENKTYGQCSITAFLAQDIFGGEVYGSLREGGNYHCYNVIDNRAFDLTSEQFGNEILSYVGNPIQRRDVHFAKEEKFQRYEYLKAQLKIKLNELSKEEFKADLKSQLEEQRREKSGYRMTPEPEGKGVAKSVAGVSAGTSAGVPVSGATVGVTVGTSAGTSVSGSTVGVTVGTSVGVPVSGATATGTTTSGVSVGTSAGVPASGSNVGVFVSEASYTRVTKDLLDFIKKSPSCYHVVSNLASMCQGYTRLYEEDNWKLQKGGKYYVVRNDSSIIAFRVPTEDYRSIAITASHSDSPSFKVKENAAMVAEGHYTRLNTEKYGGMIMSTWLDRPLSVAGRVVVRSGDRLVPRLVNVDKDLLLIPSVAIHMNRSVNDGMKYDAQVDTIPLYGDEKAKEMWIDEIAKAAGVDASDILGKDLFLYARTPGSIWGAKEEFVSSRALDDLQCAYATMQGFLQAKDAKEKLSLCCVFDNEEVGSLSGQGADSTFLEDVLARINASLGYEEVHLKQAIAAGYMISADNAHAVHPNHPEYADPTNRPYINGGIVIKYDGAKRYATDALSEAMFRDLCKECDVPVQTFANKSNLPGGTTLGNIANSHVSIKTVDIGLPQLAMHSAYETAGCKDTEYLIRVSREFFS